jgi:DNA-binding MarR family transcriptional regulator
MVSIGLLQLVPDPTDGRAKLVRYTDEGLAFARAGYRHLRYLEQRFEDEFGADYEAARGVLDRIVGLLEEADPFAEEAAEPGG